MSALIEVCLPVEARAFAGRNAKNRQRRSIRHFKIALCKLCLVMHVRRAELAPSFMRHQNVRWLKRLASASILFPYNSYMTVDSQLLYHL